MQTRRGWSGWSCRTLSAPSVQAMSQPCKKQRRAYVCFSNDAADFAQRVVDEVQQYLHDTFVDTTWPSCPHHPSHPLWYSEQWWRCEQSGIRVARVGELAAERHTP